MQNPAEWVDEYGDYLLSFALFKVSNRSVAEDLVQDTFLAAIQGLKNFQGKSSIKTWLTQILRNKIIDYYRKQDVLRDSGQYLQQTEKSFLDNFFESDQGLHGHWNTSNAPGDASFDPTHQEEQNELLQVLHNCLGKVPPKMLPVFTSRYIDEEDSAVICKEYGISSSNYWVILHRVKLILRDCLEKNWINS